MSHLIPCVTRSLSPSTNTLDAFVQHLHAENLSVSMICKAKREARHFLIWLDLCNIALEAVDDAVLCAFRRHNCQCAGMEGERRKMRSSDNRGQFLTGALRLVQFLECEGYIPHPGELDTNLRLLDDFIAHLKEEGFRPRSLAKYKNSCSHILFWLHRSRISITDFDAEKLEHFLQHDCVCPRRSRHLCQREPRATHYEPSFARFLKYLSENGLACVQTMTIEHKPDPVMVPFEAWLRHNRGIGEKTIRAYSRQAAMLIAELGPDPSAYDAAGIREALLCHYAGVSQSQARNLASTMRMYLRYLATTGRCSPFLVDAVPTAKTWQLTSLPRYINPEQIEHVIACCDVATVAGLRDRAILLLLARLALRAGDIVVLRLEDIDWRRGLVKVCGKSRRQEVLPLPQDVGDAILEYIEKARARVTEDKIFLNARAPHRPLRASSHISTIVAYALKRAGLEDVRPQGGYLFRHSAATNMLRSGRSLEVISALLRHKSMDTTTIYAKTDTPMLLEVTQPWIGDRS